MFVRLALQWLWRQILMDLISSLYSSSGVQRSLVASNGSQDKSSGFLLLQQESLDDWGTFWGMAWKPGQRHEGNWTFAHSEISAAKQSTYPDSSARIENPSFYGQSTFARNFGSCDHQHHRSVLPPNTTSKVQTMNAGIIAAFKHHFRRPHLQNTLDRNDAGAADL